MKITIAVFLAGILTWLIQGMGPWWLCGIVVMIIVFAMQLRPSAAFFTGLLGVGLSWGLMSGWIDLQNHSLLSTRIGQVIGGASPMTMVLLTALIGGLTGAMCGLTASFANQFLLRQISMLRNSQDSRSV